MCAYTTNNKLTARPRIRNVRVAFPRGAPAKKLLRVSKQRGEWQRPNSNQNVNSNTSLRSNRMPQRGTALPSRSSATFYGMLKRAFIRYSIASARHNGTYRATFSVATNTYTIQSLDLRTLIEDLASLGKASTDEAEQRAYLIMRNRAKMFYNSLFRHTAFTHMRKRFEKRVIRATTRRLKQYAVLRTSRNVHHSRMKRNDSYWYKKSIAGTRRYNLYERCIIEINKIASRGRRQHVYKLRRTQQKKARFIAIDRLYRRFFGRYVKDTLVKRQRKLPARSTSSTALPVVRRLARIDYVPYQRTANKLSYDATLTALPHKRRWLLSRGHSTNSTRISRNARISYTERQTHTLRKNQLRKLRESTVIRSSLSSRQLRLYGRHKRPRLPTTHSRLSPSNRRRVERTGPVGDRYSSAPSLLRRLARRRCGYVRNSIAKSDAANILAHRHDSSSSVREQHASGVYRRSVPRIHWAAHTGISSYTKHAFRSARVRYRISQLVAQSMRKRILFDMHMRIRAIRRDGRERLARSIANFSSFSKPHVRRIRSCRTYWRLIRRQVRKLRNKRMLPRGERQQLLDSAANRYSRRHTRMRRHAHAWILERTLSTSSSSLRRSSKIVRILRSGHRLFVRALCMYHPSRSKARSLHFGENTVATGYAHVFTLRPAFQYARSKWNSYSSRRAYERSTELAGVALRYSGEYANARMARQHYFRNAIGNTVRSMRVLPVVHNVFSQHGTVCTAHPHVVWGTIEPRYRLDTQYSHADLLPRRSGTPRMLRSMLFKKMFYFRKRLRTVLSMARRHGQHKWYSV